MKLAIGLLIGVSLMVAIWYAAPGHAQSISQPMVTPTHCIAGQADPCKVIISRNALTGILVAKASGLGTITDSLGATWFRDECTPYDDGVCIFHAQFNSSYPIGDVFTFPSNGFSDVYVLQYEGTWNFVSGQYGTYNDQNSVFHDCINGQNCPYDWTLPVDADAGNLLISYSYANSFGPGLAKPGIGYQIEASDGILAVEDMIAPTEGVFIGSLVWKNADGSDSGGSHWLMGIGAYSRVR